MNRRLALLELAAQHRLEPGPLRALWRMGGFETPPDHLANRVRRGLAILGAALGGLGIVFWIAANWQAMGRSGHFALLQGFVLVMCVGAAFLPAARTALALLATIAVGALFAYFGQAYQTGADPWQLFALWAGLTIPLCFGARSDSVWSLWAAIASVAVAQWHYAHAGHTWDSGAAGIVHAGSWTGAAVLTLLLSKPARRYTGAGQWAFGTMLTLATVFVTFTALASLSAHHIPVHYWLALVLLSLAAWGLAWRWYDIYGLSVVSLAVNVLLFGALTHLLFVVVRANDSGALLLLGLAAAGLLAGTVRTVLHFSKKHGEGADL